MMDLTLTFPVMCYIKPGIGEPDLIEIKGVTFCGKSDASSLRMENVPWHHEVRK
jgi:wyosine [tRNA(Phe)-imidazoG37] synthetase (radical SAM superfamily)